MDSSLQLIDSHPLARYAADNKDSVSSIKSYLSYIGGRPWWTPDLDGYRDALVAEGKAPSTVVARLSAVKSAYKRITRDRDLFYALTPPDGDTLMRKAFVDESIQRIKDALDEPSGIKIISKQDTDDREGTRLTAGAARALLAAPGTSTLLGLRDTTLIAVMLCTGIREAEAGALKVSDLEARLNGELALIVRDGKGGKQRLIPYGELSWCLDYVRSWITRAGLTESDLLFHAIHKSGLAIIKRGVTTRTIQRIVASYPILHEGRLTVVHPHDLRRTYARRMYEVGMELVAIQQNLGHANIKTTLGYIGSLDASTRRGRNAY